MPTQTTTTRRPGDDQQPLRPRARRARGVGGQAAWPNHATGAARGPPQSGRGRPERLPHWRSCVAGVPAGCWAAPSPCCVLSAGLALVAAAGRAPPPARTLFSSAFAQDLAQPLPGDQGHRRRLRHAHRLLAPPAQGVAAHHGVGDQGAGARRGAPPGPGRRPGPHRLGALADRPDDPLLVQPGDQQPLRPRRLRGRHVRQRPRASVSRPRPTRPRSASRAARPSTAPTSRSSSSTAAAACARPGARRRGRT